MSADRLKPLREVRTARDSMGGQRRDIYLRAHTEKVVDKARKSRKKTKTLPNRWPERCLIIDTETRTDVHQRLMFGIYRECKLVDGRYCCESEGVVYSGSYESSHLSFSAVLAKEELNTIGTFVSNTFADVEVEQFPPRVRFQVHQSFPEFMQKIFWPAVRKGHMIVGFNLPFDLSRLSLDWRPIRGRRGFTLIMSKQLDYKSKTWKSHPYRPEIRIEAKDARTAFITRGEPRFRKDEWPHPLRPVDLSTLLFSLFDKHMSLDDWCAEFRKKGYAVDRKLEHEPSGKATLSEIRYCRQDVKITLQLLNAAKLEFDRHPLPNLLPDKAYSPASIAKAYMHEMRIALPMQKFNLSNEINGIAMQAYYGGRAECHIRRTPVPVMRLDFVSQYCTCNTLLRNFEVLRAASVNFPDATDQVRQLLSMITLDRCFVLSLWADLRFFALVKPEMDVFPVRAAYNSRDPDKLNIGLNYLSSEQPIWFAGPDIVASILLTGKVPRIIRAIRVVPVGKQAGLKPVHLLGRVRIDPNEDDFYKHVVEQKEANKKDETLKKGLKCIGNGGAYGPLVELNEVPVLHSYYSKRLKRRISLHPKLNVYSGEHFHQQNAARDMEAGGPFYLPPLASLITAGGRLLLAMAEKCVMDAGGHILFCDTDSLCIVASEKSGNVPVSCNDLAYAEGADMREFAPILALSRETVVRISQQFTSLNPFSFGGTILKVEDVNHEDDDPRKPFRDLYGHAISAKRYCLFEGKHARKIVDAKAHGIGFLLSPIPRKSGDDEDQFAIEFWQKVLQNEGVSFKSSTPKWLNHPAMMKIPVSSPAVLGRLKGFCKPYDFVLAPVVRHGDLDLDNQAEKPILVTRFTKNPAEWLNAEYYNVRTGEPCRITVGELKGSTVIPTRSYRSVLNAYVNNAESKFNGPDGKQCWVYTRGILQRMHVVAEEHRYCGKEVKRKLEQGPVDHDINFKCREYQNGKVAADASLLQRIASLSLSEREIAKGTGLHRKPVHLFCTGKHVRNRTARQIIEFISHKK